MSEQDFPGRFVAVSVLALGLIVFQQPLALLLFPLGLLWSVAHLVWEVSEERRQGYRS